MRHLAVATVLTASVVTAIHVAAPAPVYSVEVDAVVGGRVPAHDDFRVEVSTSFEPIGAEDFAALPGTSVPLAAELRQDVVVMAHAVEAAVPGALLSRAVLTLRSRPLAGIVSAAPAALRVELPGLDVRPAPRDR